MSSETTHLFDSIAESLGVALRDAREAGDRSIEAVAAELKLTVTSVRNIEAGRWAVLGAPVYLKGYLRSYGRLVDVDVSDAIEQLSLQAVEQTEEMPALARARPQRMQGYRRAVSYSIATALIAIPALVIVIRAFDGSLFDAQEAAEVVGATADAPAATDVEAPDGTEVADPVPMIASMTGLTTRRERADSPLPAAAPSFATGFEVPADTAAEAEALPVDTEAVADEPPEAARLEAVLELSLREDVWVDIRDASGRRLLFGTQAAGTTHRLPLGEGIDARMGNAHAVVAAIDGEPFDLSPHIDRDVADFQLPSSDDDS
ncbi:MAG: RodZ domain-containing protein [Pseudomonadota bacterium]